MKKRGSRNSRVAYGAIVLMNLFVLGMLVAVLFPDPPSVTIESSVAVSRRLKAPVAMNIQLGIPTRIVVSSVGIDLPVRTGSYDPMTQTWTLDTHSAFYADNSVPANNSNGATLIYGHAQWGLFAPIPAITNGATAQVYTDSGKIFSYTYASTRQVKPDDMSIFSTAGAPSLTLLTCSGAFDTTRTLVSFTLNGVATQ